MNDAPVAWADKDAFACQSSRRHLESTRSSLRCLLVTLICAGLTFEFALAEGSYPSLCLSNGQGEERSEPVASDSGDARFPPQALLIPFDETLAARSQRDWADHLGVDVEFRNAGGIDFRLIPAGKFRIRRPDWVVARSGGPLWENISVDLPFFLGTKEVTQSQWLAVMGTRPWRDHQDVIEGEEYPASCITWDNAVAFCEKVSRQDAVRYRLPSSAEWEFACRAGTLTKYSCGDRDIDLVDYAWISASLGKPLTKCPQPVGKKKCNHFGLYDMHGNVSEWCQELYDPDSLGKRTPLRITRGGDFTTDGVGCTSSISAGGNSTARSASFGFRVVRDAPRPAP